MRCALMMEEPRERQRTRDEGHVRSPAGLLVRWAVGWAAWLLVLSATGSCGSPTPSNYPTEVSVVEDSTLGPGDKIEVRVFFGAKEINRAYTLGNHGTIAVPYIGKVKVDGHTAAEVESEIQTRLADGYLKDPIVSVNVAESKSRKLTVLGEVKAPGPQTYFTGMTIIEAIGQAGDFTPMARKNAVTVTRREGDKTMKYTVPVQSIIERKAENFPMRPGDTIHVPARLF